MISESLFSSPICEFNRTVNNGSTHHKKLQCPCLWTTVTSRSFQENNLFRNQEIDKLLLEKISLAAIARVANVSEKCLQDYVKAHYAENPRKAQLISKKKEK
ncbi:MAG: hypothetical protein BRC57_14050 [Cyanobacteria bacterium QS_8_48_54]|nr:MAG: hypothetical protein BRC57_14050 [Cyanobacteria bacterium QS_8_48_54]